VLAVMLTGIRAVTGLPSVKANVFWVPWDAVVARAAAWPRGVRQSGCVAATRFGSSRHRKLRSNS